ncbi:MAG: ABC transporter ATP-binding protein, partial [Alphaproteobacteria bacterium]
MAAAQELRKSAPEMTASLPLALRMWKAYIRPHLGLLFTAMALMLVAAAMTGAMAKLMEPVIDKVFTAKDTVMLWPVAGGVFLVFAVRGGATYGQAVMMNNLSQRIVSAIQRDMFAHLVRCDLAFFHSVQSGELMSRFLADTALIRAAVTESLTGFGKNVFTVAFLIGVMFLQDWKLALISIFVFPAAAYAVVRMTKKLRKVSTGTQVKMGELTAMLGQAFQGNRHVKAYGMEEFEKERVNSAVLQIFKLMTRSFRISAIATPVAEMLSGLAIVTIIIYGGMQVMAGVSTAGKLFSFIAAFLLAFEPMKRLARLNGAMQMGFAALDRLFNLLDMEPTIK